MTDVTLLPSLPQFNVMTGPSQEALPVPRAMIRKGKSFRFTEAQIKEALEFVWPEGVEECSFIFHNRKVFTRKRRSDYRGGSRQRKRFYWEWGSPMGLAHAHNYPPQVEIHFPVDPDLIRNGLTRHRKADYWNNSSSRRNKRLSHRYNYDDSGYINFDPLNNPLELLVELLAHEMRHIWQHHYIPADGIKGPFWTEVSPYHLKEKAARIYGERMDDSERGVRFHDRMVEAEGHFYREHDADCYAMGMLRKWRQSHPAPVIPINLTEEA